MIDLKVTEGDWRAFDGFGYGWGVQFGDEGGFQFHHDFSNSKHNAYLIAQAKNMYEQLKRVDVLIKQSNLDRKLGCKLSDEINELLNACKPPIDTKTNSDKL